MFILPPIGRVLLPHMGAVGTFVPVADTMYAIPFPETRIPVYVDQVGCRVTTAGTGSFLNVRLALYRSRDGLPGELLFDSGVVAATGTGGRFVTLDKQLPWSLRDAPLWGVVMHQSGNTTNATLSASTAGVGLAYNAIGAADFNSLPTAASSTITGLTAPRSFALGFPADGSAVTWAASVNTSTPIVGLRRAA